jgi:ribosome-associated protein
MAPPDRITQLRIAPGPGLPSGLVIPAGELTERYSRASGPGGQGVNTTDSRVQLSFDVAASLALDDVQRARALQHLATRLDGTVLTVDAREFRSQRRNRVAARERLAEALRTALAPPAPPRRRTRPSRASIDRRLTGKHRRGELKRSRARPADG